MTGSAVGRCYACQCHYITHPVFPKNSWIRFTDCGVSGSPTLYRMKGKSRNTHLSGCCLLVTSSRMFSLGTNLLRVSVSLRHTSCVPQEFMDTLHWLWSVWITDSVPHEREISKHPPFRLLSLGDVIADVLFGYELRQWTSYFGL